MFRLLFFLQMKNVMLVAPLIMAKIRASGQWIGKGPSIKQHDQVSTWP